MNTEVMPQGTAGLHEVEARHVVEHFGQGALLFRLDVLAGDNGDAAAELGLRRRHPRRADDDWQQRGPVVGPRRRRVPNRDEQTN
jgi:hypothetical protein